MKDMGMSTGPTVAVAKGKIKIQNFLFILLALFCILVETPEMSVATPRIRSNM